MKELPQKWSDFLRGQPETGMGYQVISVTLNDGRSIEDIAVVESHIISEVRGQIDVSFDPNDITAVQVTHRKWQFKR